MNFIKIILIFITCLINNSDNYLLKKAYKIKSDIIVTNHPICTKTASHILNNGGSIIDTAIYAMLCEGIVAPQDSGIGGGFYGIFNINNKQFIVNARERTPKNIKFRHQITKKYCNIGIPSAIRGYRLLHNMYGSLPWKNIFAPIIPLCYQNLSYKPTYLAHAYNFTSILPYNKKLCKTLKKISMFGSQYFYKELSKMIIDDLKEYNPYITYRDFLIYKPIVSKPTFSRYQNYTIYSTAYPAVGEFIHTAFKDLLNKKDLLSTIQNTYNQISRDRFYRYFKTQQKEPILGNTHGTSNICIKKGQDYLCITSTINLYYGSRFYSKSTGIILNNQLDDIPLYYDNIPYRMIPPTSISTTIIKKNNQLDLILGGTGGSRIPAGVINVLYNFYVLNQPLNESISMNRYFYFKDTLEIEGDNNTTIENTILINKPIKKTKLLRNSYNTVTGLTIFNGSYDPRRGGLVYINKTIY